MIAALATAESGSRERALYDAFQETKHAAEAASAFVRVPGNEAGRFPLTGRGDINTYALFAELFANLASSQGRAGLIVPTGIATDATTAPFFSALIGHQRLVSIISFENEEFIFPSVHHSFCFCLMTIGTNETGGKPEFAFFLRRVDQRSELGRHFGVSADEIACINPNTRTAPLYRSREDARLTAKIYGHVPVLIDESKGEAGNPWGISFMRMLDMANDSGLFRTAAQLGAQGLTRDGAGWVRPATPEASGERWLPLYEAKMLDQYNHRYADYSQRGDDRGHRVLPELSQAQLSDVHREAESYYWVKEIDVQKRILNRSYFMGYGEATTASTYRTFVATIFPFSGVGHKTILYFTTRGVRLDACITANFNSIILDYAARTKVSYLTLAQFIVKQLPIISPSTYTAADLTFIAARVLELTYTSHSMAPFARDLGYDGPPFAWNEDRRALLRAELDVWYARAYGLTRDELRYILDPADAMGPDYPSETFRVLKNNEKAHYGEYRTARLVLAAWDAQEARLAAAQ
jgi:hypothetical protein